jgi:hypothetical protein
MKTKSVLTRTRNKSLKLPLELLQKLQTIQQHKGIREQRNTFSTLRNHSGKRCHWNIPLTQFPYLHIIEIDPGSLRMTRIHVVIDEAVLSIQRKNGKWREPKETDSAAGAAIPKRKKGSSKPIFKKASKAKIHRVSKLTGLYLNSLPPLTDHNANILISSSIFNKHMNDVHRLCADWMTKK